MTSDGKKKLIWLIKTVSVTAGVYVFFKYMLAVVMPFILAYALCKILYPAAHFLYRKLKIPVGISAAGLVTVVFSALTLAVYAFGRYIFFMFVRLLQNTDKIFAAAADIFNSLCAQLGALFGCGTLAAAGKLQEAGAYLWHNFSENFYEMMSEKGFPVIHSAVTLFVVLAISAVAAALLIKNKKMIDGDIRQSEFFFEISEIAARVGGAVGCFFKAQGIIIGIVAVICTVGLKLAGTGYALIIGLAIAVLDALPVIGSGTILVPWLIIDFFMGNYRHGIILAVIYGLCAVVREVLEARLMGSRLGINEFYMLAVTFIGMKLFGISGIILGPVGLILILEILTQMKKRYQL